MRTRASILTALAIALAASFGFAVREAGAQPFGRAVIWRAADRGHERRGGGGPAYRPPYRQGYAAPAPAPRAYAAPAPRAYVYPYPQGAEPPAYPTVPPAYGYARPPAPRGYAYAPAPSYSRRGLPLSSVMANIRRATPGRLLDAWREAGPDGRPVYRVRWAAAGGRRIDFIVDATTGAIIGQSGY